MKSRLPLYGEFIIFGIGLLAGGQVREKKCRRYGQSESP
jgi:hypothetical protein